MQVEGLTLTIKLLGYHYRDLDKLIEAVPSINDKQIYGILKDRAEIIAKETDYSPYNKRTIHEYFELLGYRFGLINGTKKTRDELANEMKISSSRVQKLESKIFVRLWRWLDSISKSRYEAILSLVPDN